jgi:hypothetical protein
MRNVTQLQLGKRTPVHMDSAPSQSQLSGQFWRGEICQLTNEDRVAGVCLSAFKQMLG